MMVDLETCGVVSGSVILTIGAVRFDPRAKFLSADDLSGTGLDPLTMREDRAFYRRVDIDSCLDLGMTQDPDTMKWWSEQDPDARFEAFAADPRIKLREALLQFCMWFKGTGAAKIWSHGATFDVAMVEGTCRHTELHIPWKFWDIRDTRTLYDFTGISPHRPMNHHHALWDALHQAEAVQRAYRTRG